jgi:hypothetical protein
VTVSGGPEQAQGPRQAQDPLQPAASSRRPPPAPDRVGRIWALAFAAILIPGILVAIAVRAAGAPLGAAGLLGLLVMLVSTVAYPVLLKRWGWVDRR